MESALWFDYESDDNAHFDAYESAFDAVAAAISEEPGEQGKRLLGFEPETGEPVSALIAHDVFCDFFYAWPGHQLLLTYAHEDKELPIHMMLLRPK